MNASMPLLQLARCSCYSYGAALGCDSSSDRCQYLAAPVETSDSYPQVPIQS